MLARVTVLCPVPLSYQAIDSNKLLWALGPRWQLHIRDHGAIFHHSQVVTVSIDKHLREVVELWDQLLNGQKTDIFKVMGNTTLQVKCDIFSNSCTGLVLVKMKMLNEPHAR